MSLVHGVALVVSVFAVERTSVAQGAATRVGKLISGSSAIKRGSITGNCRVKGNSLTGAQIDERSLAQRRPQSPTAPRTRSEYSTPTTPSRWAAAAFLTYA